MATKMSVDEEEKKLPSNGKDHEMVETSPESSGSPRTTQDPPEEFTPPDNIRGWGTLLPLVDHFSPLELVDDCYLFGRNASQTNYQNDESLGNISAVDCKKTDRYFSSYSQWHFRLRRDEEQNPNVTTIEDLASNSTYVNGEKVGKGNQRILVHNDTISMSNAKNKVFAYFEVSDEFPTDVTSKYIVARKIGAGACGDVLLVYRKPDNKKYAIKMVSKKKLSVSGTSEIDVSKKVRNETNILQQIKHPCIVTMEDTIDTKEKLYIVLEFMEGGDLFDRISKRGRPSEAVAKSWFFQLAHAIKS